MTTEEKRNYLIQQGARWAQGNKTQTLEETITAIMTKTGWTREEVVSELFAEYNSLWGEN